MKRIAIIGGGFTGLVAARKLSAAGCEVDVFESGPELGGLAACFSIEGESLEKAYHHLFRTDTDILSLVSDLNANELLEWHNSSVSIFRKGRMWPFMSPMDLIRFGACSFIGRIRIGLTALYLKKTKNWTPLVQQTAMDWMRKFCGNSATDAIWAPLLRGKFSGYANKISMAWLWARLHVRANSRDSADDVEKLGYFRGGFIRLIDRLETDLVASGVRIHKNARIEEIRSDDGTPAISREGVSSTYDRVIFTGSNGSFARILPRAPEWDAYRGSLARVPYLGTICLVFSSLQDLGPHYWINVSEDDAPFLVVIQHTNLIPKERYRGKNVYYIGAYLPQESGTFLTDDATLTKEWFAYLGRMFPHFDPSSIAEQHIFRLRDAQHVVETDYAEKRPEYRTPLPGVYLSNFTQIFPEDRGTNFAVREGKRIADLVLSEW